MSKFKAATHDTLVHWLVFLLPYRTWLRVHEANAIWAGLLPKEQSGSWQNVPNDLSHTTSSWKAFVHDALVHPMSVVLPFPVWARWHNRNAKWAFGGTHLDRDPNPVPEK